MKYIFVNLKRFDIPKSWGGINTLCGVQEYGAVIVKGVDRALEGKSGLVPAVFFPEAYLLDAGRARHADSPLQLGVQGVFRRDVGDGNIGAFTTQHTARCAAALGCTWAMVGHSEERANLKEILAEGGAQDFTAVHRILRAEVKAAQAAGLNVLFCVGETAEETDRREQVLEQQLRLGLEGADLSKVVAGYEPIWAIGPGKTPPDAPYIAQTARMIKNILPIPVVYGGGLKEENAAAIGALPEVDGGLIGLTRFSGEVGFYPEEYAAIIEKYLQQ